jgi:hypothetical protein
MFGNLLACTEREALGVLILRARHVRGTSIISQNVFLEAMCVLTHKFPTSFVGGWLGIIGGDN